MKGTRFGKNEEFELDWKSPTTFLMSCSANWGAGGYVLVGEKGELKIGGYEVKDRKDATMFQLVDCDTYNASEYVNQVLVPRPLPAAGGATGRERPTKVL